MQNFVDAVRGVDDGVHAQLQNEYGLDPETGDVTDIERLTRLDDARRETARLLRDMMEHYLAAGTGRTAKDKQQALTRIVREQAFTVLNRLCALRMAEARGLLIESIARGYQSKGFQLYVRLAGTALGETGDAYRCYIVSIFDEFAIDLLVVFDRFSPYGRLFPREAALLPLLAEINHPDIDPLWAEDETIGWIYQYFNTKDERKAMRDASQAPRNSRELAVRNQFFTPRYVVEFLTDNTLGRIWYEMTQGTTVLKERCRYLVRRADEVFLAASTDEGSEWKINGSVLLARLLQDHKADTFPEFSPTDDHDEIQRTIEFSACVNGYIRHEWQEGFNPDDSKRFIDAQESLDLFSTQELWDRLFFVYRADCGSGGGSELWRETWVSRVANEIGRRCLVEPDAADSQETLLTRTLLVPHRPLKDPREIKMMDPACGSMHFGLYAFDLFEVIYSEAWDLEEKQHFIRTEPELRPLRETYGSKEALLRDVPRLIIERNIHGIDIDPRAVQIAGLSLWLRAQKSWQALHVAPQHRPKIERSNIVSRSPCRARARFFKSSLMAT